VIDDEAVLFDPAHDTVHYLNPTALFVWILCDGRHGIESITAAVADEFDLDSTTATGDEVREDVCRVIDELIDNGLLDLTEPGDS
jgi:hypothetical protein